ncbi:hypothetical protein FRB90_012484, partial [Tulasnella sp. 427]
RIFEGFLYEKAHGLQRVANACGSQIGESTKNHRDGVSDHILGVYGSPQDQPPGNEPDNTQSDSNTNNTSDQSDDSDSHQSDDSESHQADDSDSHSVGEDSNTFTLDPNPHTKERKKSFKFEKGSKALALNVVDRAVVRIVFTEKGLSLWNIKSCRQLLLATRDWVTGIQELWLRKIVHRDISTGNLLISETPGKPAFLIDPGLAHYEATPPEPTPPETHEKDKDDSRSAQDFPQDPEPNAAETMADHASDPQRAETLQGSRRYKGAQQCGDDQAQDRKPKDHHHLTPVEFEDVFDIIDRALQRLEQESSSNEPSQPRKTAREEVVSALEVPSPEEQDDKASSASEQHKSLSKQSSKRKLSDLKSAESQTTMGAQPQEEDDVREGSSRGGSRRRVV